MSESFKADPSPDAGSMAVTDANFRHSATFSDIRGRSLAKQQRLHARTAERSLQEPQRETDTFCTTSVSSDKMSEVPTYL